MRVLVTGGAGYIGAHVVKALHDTGHSPITYDNLSTGHAAMVKYGRFVQGDIGDQKWMRAVLHDFKIEAVCHLAARTSVEESTRDPLRHYFENVSKTREMMRAIAEYHAAERQPVPIVFASSCAVYGEPKDIPITEYTKIDPVSPYGAGKFMVERILDGYAATHSALPALALRFFNVAGADPDGEIGDCNTCPTNVIPILMRCATNDTPFELYGSGQQMRDYVHVSDIAAAFPLALNHLVCGGERSPINLCNATGWTVRDLIARIETITGKKLEIIQKPPRAGDVQRLTGTYKTANDILGWAPTMSVAKQIRHAWDWLHSPKNPTRRLARLVSA